jgi:hypothetical protein
MKFSSQDSAPIAGADSGREGIPSRQEVRDYTAQLLQELTNLAELNGDVELHRLLEPISKEAAKLRQRAG